MPSPFDPQIRLYMTETEYYALKSVLRSYADTVNSVRQFSTIEERLSMAKKCRALAVIAKKLDSVTAVTFQRLVELIDPEGVTAPQPVAKPARRRRQPRRDPDHPDTPSLQDQGIYPPDYSS